MTLKKLTVEVTYYLTNLFIRCVYVSGNLNLKSLLVFCFVLRSGVRCMQKPHSCAELEEETLLVTFRSKDIKKAWSGKFFIKLTDVSLNCNWVSGKEPFSRYDCDFQIGCRRFSLFLTSTVEMIGVVSFLIAELSGKKSKKKKTHYQTKKNPM